MFFQTLTMTGEIRLAALRKVAWRKRDFPDVLKACIPARAKLEKTDDRDFGMAAKMKADPVVCAARPFPSHHVDTRIVEKHTQLSLRLVNGTARKTASKFFAHFARAI
jgi:carbon monoxide dehydrogenase subunit G